jgi:SiaC family regulatory phosphoprotein
MEIQDLIVEQTPKTPQIDLNQLTGDLIFSGRSIPEDAAKVYEPVFFWVKEYISKARPVTNLRLRLEYFNTASILWLAKIFRVLTQINVPDYVLIVHLYMPIEDYKEMDDFEDIIDTFGPIEDIVQGAKFSIGIKLHGLDDKGEIIQETLVFV